MRKKSHKYIVVKSLNFTINVLCARSLRILWEGIRVFYKFGQLKRVPKKKDGNDMESADLYSFLLSTVAGRLVLTTDKIWWCFVAL